MKRRTASGALAGAAVAALLAALVPVSAAASPAAHDPAPVTRSDNMPGPLTKQRNDLRQKANEKVAKGQAVKNANGVVEVEDGKFAETETTGQDKIFTILAEFGEKTDSKLGDTPGPVHNQIPEPDRAVDNSTEWAADFSKAHYEETFNGTGDSMRTYYEGLSNGRYSVTNTVSDWVKVPYNGSYYGDNTRENTGGAWDFVGDAGNSWWDSQLAAGKSAAEIDAYLAQFDVWDRNDWDHDGDFDEPDGYLDHFQAVHSGEGEEAGGGALGEDAIWAHRWYVHGDQYGLTGPQVGDTQNKAGGTPIGGSKYWIGDYTTEPENGGLGVFCHEFGHDLGLPDFYDTNGGENSTGFWTLMSSGSWLGHGAAGNAGIGTYPGLMGADEKLFLGWLDYSTVPLGASGDYTLNPSQAQVSGKDQAVRVNLPDKTVSTHYTDPPSGSHAWWTGSADNLNQSLTREIPAASKITVAAKSWYSIEADFDQLVGEYSTDGGANWVRAGEYDGDSAGKWTALKFSYDAGGQPSLFRFRYQTDGGVHLDGAFLDDITVKSGGTTLFSDDVEQGANGWTAEGDWKISTGTETGTFEQYYLVENREYVGSDAVLAEGPYQFSKPVTAPDLVEFFKFQNGMLVWYVDKSQDDNNTSVHPGSGASMVVDARPAPFAFPDGSYPSNRRQPFDATFGLEQTDSTCLHSEVVTGHGNNETVTPVEACAPASPGIPVFDDTDPDAYYSSGNPQGSVRVAGHGAKVTVTGDAGDDLAVSVVNPAA